MRDRSANTAAYSLRLQHIRPSLQQQREGGFVTACGKLMDALRASIDAQKKKAPAPSTQA
jgi:hypothetical protein